MQRLIVEKAHERSVGKELRDAVLICLFAAAAVTSACHRNEPAKGPMEKAGESVDNAASKTKDTVKGAVDGAKDGAKDDDHK
ncbi:MAG: hypothetical protein ABI461_20910 [Polyangiaceae bacterium]